MPVAVRLGDMFSSSAQTLVNTVNCVGIMGKGVALEFKKRYPAMFGDYVKRCEAKTVRLGQPYLWRGRPDEKWVLNFPTKGHWRSVSRLADIQAGLEYLQRYYKSWEITSLAVPPLGCGQGGLEWRVVGRTLYRELSKLDIPVELYAPPTTSLAEMEASFLANPDPPAPDPGIGPVHLKIPAGWVALVAILDRIGRDRRHWPVGRTTFQKIAYFATTLGIPTGFTFTRGHYGPFAPQIKRLLSNLVNNGIAVEQQLGKQMIAVRPGPTSTDAFRLYAAQLDEWRSKIDKVADLFARMSSHQAEVAATVLYVTNELKTDGAVPSERDVLERALAWKAHRVEVDELAECVRSLNILSWLGARFSGDLIPGDELELDQAHAV